MIHRIFAYCLGFKSKAHFSRPLNCTFYNRPIESMEHLFLQCDFARAVWFEILLTIRPNHIHPQDIFKWFELMFHYLD